MMFKKLLTLLATVLMSAMVFAASSAKSITIATVGIFPMKNIVNIAKNQLEKEGYSVKVVYSDYKLPNKLLVDKQIDASFIEHIPYMRVFNAVLKGNMTPVAQIYNMNVAFYSKKVKNLSDLRDGARIAIPTDPVNQEWCLEVLAKNGLFKLADKKSGNFYTPKDIVYNPRHFVVEPTEILSLAQKYNEADLVFNWPSMMLPLGLKPLRDGIIKINDRENNNIHAITLMAREDNINSDKIQALKKAMTSKEVYDFLINNYSTEGYPIFTPSK